MFWGLIVIQNKKYTQIVEKTFRVTQASLDVTNTLDDDVQVILGNDDKFFLLCTLRVNHCVQAPLNLLISKGEKISFSIKGEGVVHLTGYVEDDYNESDDDLNASDEKVNMKIAKKSKNNPKLVNDNEDSDDSDDSDYKNGSNVTKDDDDVSDDNSDNDENDKDGSDDKENDDDDEAADEEAADFEQESTDNDDDDDEDDDDDDDEAVDEDDDDDDDISESEEEVAPVVKRPKIDVNQKSKENGLQKKDGKKDKQMIQQDQKKGNKKPNQQQSSKSIISGGIKIEDLRVGKGQPVKNGQNVRVYYEGRLESNNKIFDSSLRGPGFTFKLGKGEVIKGWDLGVVGMAVGGKRRLVIPSNLAYGIKGSPPVIPPNSNLIFDVEVRHAN